MARPAMSKGVGRPRREIRAVVELRPDRPPKQVGGRSRSQAAEKSFSERGIRDRTANRHRWARRESSGARKNPR